MSPSARAIEKKALTKRKMREERRREQKLKKAKKNRINKETTRHHRTPSAIGGSDASPNVIRVPKMAHRWWHNLFKIKSPFDIVRELNRLWLPLDAFALVVPTSRAKEALDLLMKAGIVPTADPRAFGAIDDHRIESTVKKNGHHMK